MKSVHLVVSLWLSMTSLITCSQDTCPVVSYNGRNDVTNQINGSAILGYSYRNLTTDTIQKCFSTCVHDCRCVSYQVSGNRCELVDESRHTAPESFKPVSGYVYSELIQTFKNKRTVACSSRCYNGCCRSPLCQNGGTCIELCDNVTRKFECQCQPGTAGRICEFPTSCLGYRLKTSPDLYPIMTSNTNKMNLYCDMTSEPGMVWTLIESFSLSNKYKYRNKDFVEDFPVNENNFNWSDYRLPLSVMQYIKNHSTHWRATCNYDTDGLVKTDYVRGRLSDIDIITFLRGFSCFRVEYINGRGMDCSNCTTHMRQNEGLHMFIDSLAGAGLKCDINFMNGSVITDTHDTCDYFGKYQTVNKAHRCTARLPSTTQWWLGILKTLLP